MQSSVSFEGLSEWESLLQGITKFAVACYAVGFFIDYVFVSQRGASGMDFIRPRYILVGGSWFAQAAFIYFFASVVRHTSRCLSKFNRWFIYALVFVVFAVWVGSVVVPGIYIPKETKIEKVQLWSILVLGMLFHVISSVALGGATISVKTQTLSISARRTAHFFSLNLKCYLASASS